MRPPVALALLVALGGLAAPAARAQWTWLPEHRLVPALLADPLEPGSGVHKHVGTDRIEARVGVLRDLVRYDGRPVLGVRRAAVGVSGQAAMLLRLRRYGEKSPLTFPFGFRQLVDFPLDTGDYTFGLYASAERDLGPAVTARARAQVVHVSSHLGDGRYDGATGTWRDGRAPIDYSRNYLQLLLDAAHRPTGLRAYVAPAGLTYHSPAGGERAPGAFVQGGLEWRGPGFGPRRLLHGFGGADVRTFPRLTGTRARTGAAYVAGLRVGAWGRRGLDLQATRYAGASWRGQFYGLAERSWALGFRLTFDG